MLNQTFELVKILIPARLETQSITLFRGEEIAFGLRAWLKMAS